MSETRTVNMVLPSDIYARLVERARKESLVPAICARRLFEAGLAGGKAALGTAQAEQIDRLTEQLVVARRDLARAESRAENAGEAETEATRLRLTLPARDRRIVELEQLLAQARELLAATPAAPEPAVVTVTAAPSISPETVPAPAPEPVVDPSLIGGEPPVDLAPVTIRTIRAMRAAGMTPQQIARQVDQPVAAVRRVIG